MRQAITDVYLFSELPEDIQNKIISNSTHINVNDEWWDGTYEDAKNVGLNITGFDLGRGYRVDGEFIGTARETANKIITEHGKDCDTYKTAQEFILRDDKFNTVQGMDRDDYTSEDSDNEFLKDILRTYWFMLQGDYEYQTSDQSIKETLLNDEDQEYTITGSEFNH